MTRQVAKLAVHWDKEGNPAVGPVTSNRMRLTCGRCRALLWNRERRDWFKRHGNFVDEHAAHVQMEES